MECLVFIWITFGSFKFIKSMFRFAVDVSTCLKLTSTYFCSDGQFYEQTEGLQWAHHFFPVVANFFMEDSEKKALEQATHKPVCCF